MESGPSVKCCDIDHTKDAPGSRYYVSAIDGDRRALVAGPYQTHGEALGDVEAVQAVAYELDVRSHFYAWGTARTCDDRPGVLNAQLAAYKARGVVIVQPAAVVSLTTG